MLLHTSCGPEPEPLHEVVLGHCYIEEDGSKTFVPCEPDSLDGWCTTRYKDQVLSLRGEGNEQGAYCAEGDSE